MLPFFVVTPFYRKNKAKMSTENKITTSYSTNKTRVRHKAAYDFMVGPCAHPCMKLIFRTYDQ